MEKLLLWQEALDLQNQVANGKKCTISGFWLYKGQFLGNKAKRDQEPTTIQSRRKMAAHKAINRHYILEN